VDGLARRPREVVGDTGDPSLLLEEVFRGGVDGRAGGCEDFEDLGDGSLGGSFSCRKNLALQSQKSATTGIHLNNGGLLWRV